MENLIVDLVEVLFTALAYRNNCPHDRLINHGLGITRTEMSDEPGGPKYDHQ